MNVNRVFLGGYLTRDPELRNVGDTTVCDFGVACNRKWKSASGEEREEVLFIDCAAWGKTGEVIANNLHKGSPIFVEGRLRLETWEDKGTGAKRSKITCTVDNFQFVGEKAGPANPKVQPGEAREPGEYEPSTATKTSPNRKR